MTSFRDNLLAGKTAFVTGGSGGIGAETAFWLARNGVRVTLAGRNLERLEAAHARLAAISEGHAAAPVDCTDLHGLEAARDAMLAREGRLDILIAFAGGGTGRPGPLETTAEADWRSSIDHNLTATFLTLRAFIPALKATRGAVVTMADMSTLEVEADVSESNLSRTGVGQPVEIMLDALPGRRFRGHVASIVPTVDRAKATVMTKIKFDELDARILPEMSAKVSFLSPQITDADQQPVMAVAAAAIADRGGASVVYRLKAGDNGKFTAEEVPVKPGRKLGDLREISGPLKSGDKLVSAPPATLKNGSRINLGAP